jgi:hypothetical protein
MVSTPITPGSLSERDRQMRIAASPAGENDGRVLERIVDGGARYRLPCRPRGFGAAQHARMQRAHPQDRQQPRGNCLRCCVRRHRKRFAIGQRIVAGGAGDNRHDWRAARDAARQAFAQRGIARGVTVSQNDCGRIGGLDRGARLRARRFDHRKGAGLG